MNKYDLAIIGGGPAGVAAGVYASRKKIKTVFLTKDWQSQSVVSPNIENWIGETSISGSDLSKRLENHLKTYSKNILDIKEGEIVLDISKKENYFEIKTNKSSYSAFSVLVASGSHRKKLDILGAKEFDNKGLTYCATCDGPLFEDKDVAVIGGGNAAFETAAQLLAYCKSVTIINRSDKFRADEITVEAVLKNPKINVIKNVIPTEIKGDKFVESIVYKDSQNQETHELKVSGIFVEIGHLPNTDFAKNVVILDELGRIKINPKNQRTDTLGIWAAGDATDGLYHQNNIAAGDAVKALEDIYIYLHNLKK